MIMKYRIGESRRMFSVLANDSYKNPEKIINLLSAEFKIVAEQYLNLDGDIKVRYKISDNGLLFFVEMPAKSVRNIFCL